MLPTFVEQSVGLIYIDLKKKKKLNLPASSSPGMDFCLTSSLPGSLYVCHTLKAVALDRLQEIEGNKTSPNTSLLTSKLPKPQVYACIHVGQNFVYVYLNAHGALHDLRGYLLPEACLRTMTS